MKKLDCVVLFVLFAMSGFLVSADEPATRVRFGVAVEDVSNAYGTLDTIAEEIGAPIDTLSIYRQFGGNYNLLDLKALSYAREHGMTINISWEPFTPGQNDIEYLTRIVNGDLDSYLSDFVAGVKEYGDPIVIRFAPEMNTDWQPWSNRSSDDFKNAYIYLYEFFETQGVTNVSWMWSVNVIENYLNLELSDYYPGDEYVDSIGIDGYNWGTTQSWGSIWQSFSEVFGPTYKYLTERYTQPIIISEMGSAEEGGDKAAWIKNMFDVLPTRFPKIVEIDWFNIDKETQWPIESSQESIDAFHKALSKPA